MPEPVLPPLHLGPPVTMSDGLARLYLIALVIFAGRCLMVAVFGGFPNPFDELAHVSLVRHLAEHGGFFPPFADLRMLDPLDPAAWTPALNYLNHPSPYYLVMSWLALPLLGSPDALVLGLRLANSALAVSGMAVVLWLGRQAGWSSAAQVTFVALVVANPTLPVLGGIVTNDNLAFFGGALCCAGVFGLLQGRRSGGVWLLIALGFALASVAKLTAALLCGALLAFALARCATRGGLAALRSPAPIAALVICVLGALPYLAFAVEYGSPAPLTEGQAAMLAERLAELPEWRDQRYGLAAYLGHFAQSLLVYWPPAPPETHLEIALLAAPAACLVIGWLGIAQAARAMGRGESDAMAAFVVYGALAIGLVILVHIGFTFQRHLETGWLRGVYPRYYFPLLPVLPAACAWLISSRRSGRSGILLAGALVTLAIGYDLLHRLAATL